MKKMKRSISILLIAIMVLGIFAGCGKKEEENVDIAGTKLTVGIPSKAKVTDFDDNGLTNYIKEALDIKLEFVSFSSSASEYKQQISLMCTSHEKLPDVLLGFYGLGSTSVKEFGENGFFLELSDLIEKYATTYKEQRSKLTEEQKTLVDKKMILGDSKSIYGMPLLLQGGADSLQNLMYINKTWLDNLGLQVPTTTDELYTVLKAFKEKDPNGNGIADEIPMLGGYAGRGNDITSYLINPFVYYDSANKFNVTDGKVWDSVVSDEFRQALIWCNKLVSEGLFYKESFTLASNAEYIALYSPEGDVSLVGVMSGHPEVYTDAANDNLDEYVALDYLKDATGKGGYTVMQPTECYLSCFITKDCKNEVAAMKLIDFFFEDETISRVRRGVKDVDWVSTEGTAINGEPAHIDVSNEEAFFSGNSTWCINIAGFINTYNFNEIVKENATKRQMSIQNLFKGTYEIVDNARVPKELAVELVFTDEEAEINDEYKGQGDTFINTSINLFMTGEQNPNDDAQWKKYVDTLYKDLKRDKILANFQAAYAREK